MNDGLVVDGLVADGNGNLFGVRSRDGVFDDGTVFEVQAGTHALTVLASFDRADGSLNKADGSFYLGAYNINDGGDLAMDDNGNLFGAATYGGLAGFGTVFEVVNGSGTITKLADFNFANGAYPTSVVLDKSGNLFGTTQEGGSFDAGTVFELAKGSHTVTTLGSFDGHSGARPQGGLTLDSSGNIFGTVASNGLDRLDNGIGDGAVFEVPQGGSGITILASFNGSNGSRPQGTLVEDSGGNLYGTTTVGGSLGLGTIFELQAGNGTITALASFAGGNGANPSGRLIEDAGGNFFGTTTNGGAMRRYDGLGYGAVFEFARAKATLTAISLFNGANGSGPGSGVIEDSQGNLLGTTSYGGPTDDGGISSGLGTVFEVAKGGGPLTTLAAFQGSSGALPRGNLVADSSGDLFGTTSRGGAYGYGTIFELPHGRSTIVVLAAPAAGVASNLVLDSSGNLFGLDGGGAFGRIFELAHGSNVLTTVATFDATNRGANSLSEDSSGDFFGTTPEGGASSQGTIFEVVQGSDTVTTLATFDGANGFDPTGVISDTGGNLFGSTEYGGPSNAGTVFDVLQGSNSIVDLASFDLVPYNRVLVDPYPGPLVEDSNGDLFGTTANGGGVGGGSVFEVMQGSSTITTLVSFDGTNANGNGFQASAGLLMDPSGNLFGTTRFAGSVLTATAVYTYGFDTVFEVNPGSGTLTTLAYFNGANGESVYTPLVEDSRGNLFGSTSYGGPTYNDLEQVSASGEGTVFELPASPVALSPLMLPDWTVNQPGYSQTISASGGTWPYTFAATGTLPPGLSLSSQGMLSGTPTVPGVFNFTVTAMDAAGASTGQTYNIVINPVVTVTTMTLPSGVQGVAYSTILKALGGTTFNYTYTATGNLPPGLFLSSSGTLSGTPTASGSFAFTVIVTDTVGASASHDYTLTISAGPFSQYLVTLVGPSTIQASNGVLVSVQAADAFGNPVTNYSGPATVTATFIPSSAANNFTATVAINSSGLGLFVAKVRMIGTYTIYVADSSNPYTGNSPPVTVTPGPAAQLAFVAQPLNSATGVSLPLVSVQVEDQYGNVISSDNSDTVTLGIASGPGSLTPGSASTAAVSNGIAIFNNLTLVTPGTYQFSAIVAGHYTGPNSAPFTVQPLEVVPGSFQGSTSGFSLQLNVTLLVNAQTPALYGSGSGVTGTVTLTQTTGTPPTGATLPYQVPGSLIVDPATNTLTFVETDTASVVGNGTPLLPDGVYVVHISSSGANGLQALDGGGYLDGTDSGTPGHDFTATFTMDAAAARDDVLWVPATAEGPGQPLSAPGMNQIGGGYPVYLDDHTGNVTDATATLTYSPSLLIVTPTSTAAFTVTVPSPGTALLHYHGPAPATGTQTAIGFLTAMVPAGTTGNPVPYKASDLLTLSAVSLNGGTIPAVGGQAVHLVAYVGDANGDGAYSSSDALLITRVTLQTDTGFAAYPLVDPVIVADIAGSGFIPADAALQVNEAGVGVPTANLPVPPIQAGVHFQPLVYHAHPSATINRADALPSASGHDNAYGWLLPPSTPDMFGGLSWYELGSELARLLAKRI